MLAKSAFNVASEVFNEVTSPLQNTWFQYMEFIRYLIRK